MSYGSDTPGGASEGVGGMDSGSYGYGGNDFVGPQTEANQPDFGSYMDAVNMGPPTEQQSIDLGNQFANDLSAYANAPYGSLSSMFSNPMDARLAMGTAVTPTNPESSFFDSKLFGALKNIGLFAARATPIGQLASLANLGYSAYKGAPVGATIGGMAAGLPGAVAGLGIDAATGKNVSGQTGGMAGSMIGNAISPGVGGLIGGMIGSEAAQGLANRGTTNNMDTTNTGFDLNSALTGLGGIYSAYQGNQQAQNTLNTLQNVQQQMPSLDSLFGPNSAAYGRMKAELAAKDAAAGRRSQYGPRAAELEAKMAGLMGQYGPSMMQAQTGNLQQQGAASTAANTARNQNLNALLQFGKQSGLGDYLQGLWNRNVTPTDMSGFYSNNTPAWDGGTETTQPWTSLDTTNYSGPNVNTSPFVTSNDNLFEGW